MIFNALRQPQKPWALVLALALLLLTGWGQVHRVLHPAATVASVLADSRSGHDQAALHVGHESGGGLCLLLDHLADGTAPLAWPLLALASSPVRVLPVQRAVPSGVAQARPFDARGPPVFA